MRQGGVVVLVGVVSAYIAVGPAASAPTRSAHATVRSASCANYIVIDSRGSGEQTRLSKPGSVFVGFFRAAVKRRDADAKVAVIPNSYPAWGSIPTLVSALLKLPQRYHESVVEGKDWLSGQISTLRTKCPNSKLILTGYSQGAQVTGDVYQEHSFNNILGVVLFGDPKFNSADPAARGGKVGLDGALGTRPLYRAKPGKQSIGRVLSYCHEGDPVCQGVSRLTLAGMKLAHGSYGATDEPREAADYVARFVPRSADHQTSATINLTQAARGDFSSLGGKWTVRAYASNPHDGTGVQWVSGSPRSKPTLATYPRKLVFGGEAWVSSIVVTHEGLTYSVGNGPQYLRLRWKLGKNVLTASPVNKNVPINWTVFIFPKRPGLPTNNGVKLDPKPTIVLWNSSNGVTLVYQR